MQNVLELIGRQEALFAADMRAHEDELAAQVRASRFLVIGGAGSVGHAVTRELWRRHPRRLHVVDISENNLVEVVRELRSSGTGGCADFATFAIDCGSPIFQAFMEQGDGYDYVLNLSALKHVRSERDPYTLMRLIEVNILNTDAAARLAQARGARKFFSVSTDKAANPANMMGASKRIMEMVLARRSHELPVSAARFANVAFSDGSLLHGFLRRIDLDQPLAAPNDVRRYFITSQEAGELCLLSCLLGANRDIFFPKLGTLDLITFDEIAVRLLRSRGYEAVPCTNEDEARARVSELKPRRQWPVFFTSSDTTGEKDVEEFYTSDETVDQTCFECIGVVQDGGACDVARLAEFETAILRLRRAGRWTREDLVAVFQRTLPGFDHVEKGKFLDARM